MAPRVLVQALRPDAVIPRYMSDHAAGLDLYAAMDAAIVIAPRARAAIDTGLAVAIPEGFEGQVRPRSGLAREHGITVVNAPGTIDADYRGPVVVLLVNLGERAVTIAPGHRIAQLVIAPVARAEVVVATALPPTSRGAGARLHGTIVAKKGVESNTPTVVLPPSPLPGPADQKTLELVVREPPRLPSPPSLPPVQMPAPVMPQRRGTLRMISMKSPAEIAAEKAARPVRPVQLRSLAEAGRHPTPPGGLGYLAPPRDPAREPKSMATWLYVLLAVIGALAIAAVIATAMWFLAFR